MDKNNIGAQNIFNSLQTVGGEKWSGDGQIMECAGRTREKINFILEKLESMNFGLFWVTIIR